MNAQNDKSYENFNRLHMPGIKAVTLTGNIHPEEGAGGTEVFFLIVMATVKLSFSLAAIWEIGTDTFLGLSKSPYLSFYCFSPSPI